MLKMLLEMSGAEVTDLKSANDALKMLDQTIPQVLVSDVGMPGMDGLCPHPPGSGAWSGARWKRSRYSPVRLCLR